MSTIENIVKSLAYATEHNQGLHLTHEEVPALNACIAELEQELNTTDGLLKEATETIGAVVACCTYNSNDDAKIGIYGIDQKAFTRIDQFMTHYNDAVSAGKVSVDVKRELTDAEIEELGAQEAERKEFCPNCEAVTPCTHEAELFVCDICGEDFAKYIVSRKASVPDVSTTQDVLIDIKTPSSIENNNPDYYKQELARRDEIITRLKEDAERLASTYVVEAFPHEWVCRGGCHHWARFGEQLDHAPDCPITLHRALMKELE